MTNRKDGDTGMINSPNPGGSMIEPAYYTNSRPGDDAPCFVSHPSVLCGFRKSCEYLQVLPGRGHLTRDARHHRFIKSYERHEGMTPAYVCGIIVNGMNPWTMLVRNTPIAILFSLILLHKWSDHFHRPGAKPRFMHVCPEQVTGF